MEEKLLQEVQFLWSVVAGVGEGQEAPGGGDALERRVGADFISKTFTAWQMEDFQGMSGLSSASRTEWRWGIVPRLGGGTLKVSLGNQRQGELEAEPSR